MSPPLRRFPSGHNKAGRSQPSRPTTRQVLPRPSICDGRPPLAKREPGIDAARHGCDRAVDFIRVIGNVALRKRARRHLRTPAGGNAIVRTALGRDIRVIQMSPSASSARRRSARSLSRNAIARPRPNRKRARRRLQASGAGSRTRLVHMQRPTCSPAACFSVRGGWLGSSEIVRLGDWYCVC